MAEARTEHWSLDKRVPLALIMTIALQTLTAVWFAAKLDAQTQANTAAIEWLTQSDERMTALMSAVIDRTTRLEAETGSYRVQLNTRFETIDRKLDMLVEQMRQRADLRSPTRSTLGDAASGHVIP